MSTVVVSYANINSSKPIVFLKYEWLTTLSQLWSANLPAGLVGIRSSWTRIKNIHIIHFFVSKICIKLWNEFVKKKENRATIAPVEALVEVILVQMLMGRDRNSGRNCCIPSHAWRRSSECGHQRSRRGRCTRSGRRVVPGRDGRGSSGVASTLLCLLTERLLPETNYQFIIWRRGPQWGEKSNRLLTRFIITHHWSLEIRRRSMFNLFHIIL